MLTLLIAFMIMFSLANIAVTLFILNRISNVLDNQIASINTKLDCILRSNSQWRIQEGVYLDRPQ